MKHAIDSWKCIPGMRMTGVMIDVQNALSGIEKTADSQFYYRTTYYNANKYNFTLDKIIILSCNVHNFE